MDLVLTQRPGIRNHSLSLDIQVTPPGNQNQSSASTFASYATGENIEGVISITSQRDLGFDYLHIAFVGKFSKRMEIFRWLRQNRRGKYNHPQLHSRQGTASVSKACSIY
jgi:hypothetical protein